MKEEKVEQFLLRNNVYFDKKDLVDVKDVLLGSSDDKTLVIFSLKFKNPWIMVCISYFLGFFGIDRFMLKDYSIGILKALILPFFLIGTSLVDYSFFMESHYSSYIFKAGLGFLAICFILFIYYIVDIFLIYHSTLRNNLNLLKTCCCSNQPCDSCKNKSKGRTFPKYKKKDTNIETNE